MPVMKKKMKAMKKEYWAKKWESVYYAMENKMKKTWIPLKKKSKWKK